MVLSLFVVSDGLLLPSSRPPSSEDLYLMIQKLNDTLIKQNVTLMMQKTINNQQDSAIQARLQNSGKCFFYNPPILIGRCEPQVFWLQNIWHCPVGNSNFHIFHIWYTYVHLDVLLAVVIILAFIFPTSVSKYTVVSYLRSNSYEPSIGLMVELILYSKDSYTSNLYMKTLPGHPYFKHASYQQL